MRFLSSVLALGLLSACYAPAEPGANISKVAEKSGKKPCRVAGIDIALECGVIEVFENRTSNAGRKIEIHFAVLRAKSDRKKPDPLFILAGGPGQSAIDAAPLVFGALERINRERDMVFVDQRGTGKSNALTCDLGKEEGNYNFGDNARLVADVKACLTKARAHADPTLYTTTIAMQDLDDVRKFLGYDKINLWGASYGTRAALEYLRRYPNNVRSAVLDGVAPFNLMLPASFITDGNAALASLIAECAKSAECAKNSPDLAADIRMLLAELKRRPREVEIAHPRTAEKIKVNMTPTVVLSAIRGALYVANVAGLVPHAITAAVKNDFAPLTTLVFFINLAVQDQMAIGMHLSVVCAEDFPLVEKLQLPQSTQNFYGAETIEDTQRMCAIWPRGEVPPDYYEAVKSDVPVLLLSGGIDPATPPRHAQSVLSGLARGKHLVAPHVGHGISAQGCAPDLIKRFVEDGNADKVDGACLAKIPRPMFYQPPTAKS